MFGPGSCKRRQSLGALMVSFVLLSASECSFIFVEAPPPNIERNQDLTCTTNYGWPIVDTLLAGFELLRTGYALSRSEADYRGMQISQGTDVGLGFGLLTLTAISAGVGYSRVGQCKDAHAAGDPEATPRRRPRLGNPVLPHQVVPPPVYPSASSQMSSPTPAVGTGIGQGAPTVVPPQSASPSAPPSPPSPPRRSSTD